MAHSDDSGPLEHRSGPPALESTRELTREVLIFGPISRRSLSARLGLSLASLTRLTRPLIERGLLREGANVADGHVGRPTRPLDVNLGSHSYIGVAVEAGRVRAVLTDLRANELESVVVPFASGHPLHVVTAIESAVHVLRVETAHERPSPAGMGVSVEGRVLDGRVLDAPLLRWRNVELARSLRARLRIPVDVENDIVAVTAAEHWFGAGRGLSRFALLGMGQELRYGLVMESRVVATADTGIGLAHQCLDPDGPRCPAGHPGCSAEILTVQGMCRQLAASIGRIVEFGELVSRATAGDPLAGAIVARAGAGLGRLVTVINGFTAVTTVVVTGEGSAVAELARPIVAATLAEAKDRESTPVSVVVQPARKDAAARGAAAIAIQKSMQGAAFL